MISFNGFSCEVDAFSLANELYLRLSAFVKAKLSKQGPPIIYSVIRW